MNNKLRRFFTVVLAFICILSVQVSVSAINIGDIGEEIGKNLNLDAVLDLIGQLTSQNPENTTTTEAETTTEKKEDVSDPVNSSGTGVHSTTASQTTTVEYPTGNYYPTLDNNANNNTTQNNDNNYVNPFFTTEPAGDESTTLSFEASLSDIFEEDSANIIVQTPNETFTIGNLVEKNENNTKDEFTWQMGALIAAAILFVILLALIAALVIQNSKKKKKRRYIDSYPVRSESAAPVSVEVMTPERIAELLGSTAGRKVSNDKVTNDYEFMSSDETAAAIKAAALMGQLSGSYSDPILRKYTDEPVMISQNGSHIPDADYSSVADILKATDYIMEDIENESGMTDIDLSAKSDDYSLKINRICPDCGNKVPEEDIFCHNCGTYIG